MALTLKNTVKINVMNLIASLIMIISIAFGVNELNKNFIFIDMIAITYAILFEVMIIAAIYAGLRELCLPEFMEFLENGFVQQLGFLLINLLLIDTSFEGLIISSIIIGYTFILFLYTYLSNNN
jgi:hypothetical protein